MPRINNLPNATTLDLSDKVLGVVGGLAKNMTLTQLKSLIGTTVEDSLTSNSATNAASVHQVKLLNDALANKLDSSAYVPRYTFVSDSNTTYTVPASAVTENGRTIIELSNNSLTSITINTATGTGKVAGDSVNISITGTCSAQALVASGVTLQGDLLFSYQYQTKTLVYKGSNVWKVVG